MHRLAGDGNKWWARWGCLLHVTGDTLYGKKHILTCSAVGGAAIHPPLLAANQHVGGAGGVDVQSTRPSGKETQQLRPWRGAPQRKHFLYYLEGHTTDYLEYTKTMGHHTHT
jgi:hypothetical protein